MANSLLNLAAEWWRPLVQDFLNNMLIGRDICNTKVEEQLVSGQSVNFPQTNDLIVQDYVQGTDLSITPLSATNSLLTVDQSKAVTMAIDPRQEKQATSKYVATMAQQAAFRLANDMDKKILGDCASLAFQQVNAGTLSTSTMYALLTDNYARLFLQNATDRELFAVVDSFRLSLLSQAFVSNGFMQADQKLEEGFSPFRGMAGGFRVYVSNNLPATVSLTLAVQPTAGDHFTLFGATWTFVATGTAALPGDISIGASLAATQANVVNAINGTGTPGASTYIDISPDQRFVYTNNDVNAGAFSVGNVSVLTGVGHFLASEAFTSGSNFFGVETTKLLFGSMGAPSLAVQMLPELYIRPEPKQIAQNYITYALYGHTVFTRDQRRLVAVTINS
jgi:hypothetical protein